MKCWPSFTSLFKSDRSCNYYNYMCSILICVVFIILRLTANFCWNSVGLNCIHCIFWYLLNFQHFSYVVTVIRSWKTVEFHYGDWQYARHSILFNNILYYYTEFSVVRLRWRLHFHFTGQEWRLHFFIILLDIAFTLMWDFIISETEYTLYSTKYYHFFATFYCIS